VGVLSIDLFVVGSHVYFKIAISFPLWFQNLDFPHFLLENSIGKHISQQSLADVSVSFELGHKVFEEDREIADEHEERSHC